MAVTAMLENGSKRLRKRFSRGENTVYGYFLIRHRSINNTIDRVFGGGLFGFVGVLQILGIDEGFSRAIFIVCICCTEFMMMRPVYRFLIVWKHRSGMTGLQCSQKGLLL